VERERISEGKRGAGVDVGVGVGVGGRGGEGRVEGGGWCQESLMTAESEGRVEGGERRMGGQVWLVWWVRSCPPV
jgi:hypothetical protein